MGEVWRATDTKLDREVAIKVLPVAFVSDPERLARFEREAKLLAQLHHPNIASIFGIEESDGIRALVMELVEGPTLAERLEQGAIPFSESLSIARQIAEALEEAHEKGIVHRDLKPQNVKASIEGRAKVLDFGLAKAMDPIGGATGSASELAQSPTLTLGATVQGVILGTAAYMAPEQARGVAIDKRADIWAFGVVLYEMLAGRRLFEGELVTDVLASVLRGEIDFDALPAETPPALRRLLRRCLERQPKRRLHDIADARIVIDELIAGEREPAIAAPPAPAPRWRRALPWLFAGLALLAAAAAWVWPRGATPAAPRTSIELALAAPAGGEFVISSNSGWGVVSPNGRQVVFPATVGGQRGLWVRPLERAEARRLPGTDTGFYPFWSPDGRQVAFFDTGSLMRIEVAGGLPERICDAAWGRGGDWGASGWIVFNPVGGGALALVRAEGGEPIALTELDEAAGEDAHYWPAWLPGERSFLYFIRSERRENQGVYLGRVVEGGIDRDRRRVVATSSSGLYAPAAPGREAMLLWTQEDRLLARALDPVRGALDGPVAEVARGVRVLESQRATMASVSTTGTLVFASTAAGELRIESFDRAGRPFGPLPVAAGDLHQLAVSPDATQLAFVRVRGGQGDIWVHDFARGTSRALTTSAEYDEQPAWSADGREVLFRVGGTSTEFVGRRVRADGEGAPRPLLEAPGVSNILEWFSDRWALGIANRERREVVAIRLGEGGGIEPLNPPLGGISPASRHSGPAQALAYSSDQSGAAQGFVVSLFHGPDGARLGADRQRLPVEGARTMRWRQDGRELFAIGGDGALWSVPVERASSSHDSVLRLGTAEKLFEGPFVDDDFEVYANGERFLFRVDPAAAHQTLGVVLDWPARLERTRR
jgi:Tol biopolymer transport system component